MEAPKITATVRSESRTDQAVRRLSIADAPDLTYTMSTFRSGNLTRIWRVEYASISWDHGVLTSIHLRGHRVKKNGQAGEIAESGHFSIEDGKVLEHHRYPGAHLWLQQVVDQFADVPPFDGPGVRRHG